MHLLLAIVRLLFGLTWFPVRELQVVEVREDGSTRVRRVSDMHGWVPPGLGWLTPLLALCAAIRRTRQAAPRTRSRCLPAGSSRSQIDS